MSVKSPITKQSENEIKAKNKKENTMKKTVITTVVLTLVFVAYSVAMIFLGMNYNQSVNDRVHAEVKALSTVATPSK